MIPDITHAMSFRTLITQGSSCVFKSSKKGQGSPSREKKKKQSKITGTVISSQTGRFLVSGLTFPELQLSQSEKNLTFICLISSKNTAQSRRPYPQGQEEPCSKHNRNTVSEMPRGLQSALVGVKWIHTIPLSHTQPLIADN